jgi:hypothetical protein
MKKPVTLKLLNKEDFDSMLIVIQSAGYEVISRDDHTLKIVCHIDDFLLSLSKTYLNVEILHA